jgi:hypothetical protein
MDHLAKLIRNLSKEQVRYYKLFAGRTNHEHDRKDLKLFDAYRKAKDDEPDEEELAKLLYPGAGKNPWYRLKNRLLSEVNKSLSTLHYEVVDFIHACHMMALYRYFSSRNMLQEARYYLRRAEKDAESIEHFELLDIVYSEYIKHSHETLNINPEFYIEKRRKNKGEQEAVRAIDDLLAVVSYRLKTTQNFATEENPVLDLLKSTIDDFIKDRDLKNSPVLRFRIYAAVSQILLQRHEYNSLEQYLLKTYKEFERDKLFNRNNHDTKLQMLTYIVNSLFKNKKMKQSLQWADKLKAAMEEFHQLLFDKYFFFYYNALVINYSVINPVQAIEILEDLRENATIKSNSFYQLFVYLNLAVLRFDTQEYKESIRHFTRITLLDGYKNADPSLRMKINICEVITRYELNQYDVLEYKLAQIRKDYKQLLSHESHGIEKELLVIIRDLQNSTGVKNDKKLQDKILRFVDWTRNNTDRDNVIIDYPNWLDRILDREKIIR